MLSDNLPEIAQEHINNWWKRSNWLEVLIPLEAAFSFDSF